MQEDISVFDIFKIGVGPSSSHTLGPWKAALILLESLSQKNLMHTVTAIDVLLYGSLAKTGIGHATHIAVMLGLSGEDPVLIDTGSIGNKIEKIVSEQSILLNGIYKIPFNPGENIQFLFYESLPFHPNALTFLVTSTDAGGGAETYFSIGGGFVVKESGTNIGRFKNTIPYPVSSSQQLLGYCKELNALVSGVVYKNELAWRNEEAIQEQLNTIYVVMKQCIYKGCHTEGILPGGLQLKRRSAQLAATLLNNKQYHDADEWFLAIASGGNDFRYILDWVNCFALAVNEENASMGRIVTAPTNGAAGVVPAVLFYYLLFCREDKAEDIQAAIRKFLFTAAEIGSLFKKGSTISAAMGGCQAEIGVSAAMAAAGLTECMGGNAEQCLMAAEIAMEHHLGLTCDPVNGLVQIPCIERNTMGALKAINASRLALQGTAADAKVSLDDVIKTMWSTALDMNHKYKETATGGLAIHVPLGLKEC